MIEGFKKFISRGNMIDMAVGVVMGGAVTAVVNSIVNNLINPLIAAIFGKPNLDSVLAFSFGNNPDATVSFGAIIGAIINFLIVAIAVYFFILVPINKFRDMSAAIAARRKANGQALDATAQEQAPLNPDEQTVLLLQEIRDQLAQQQGSAQQPKL